MSDQYTYNDTKRIFHEEYAKFKRPISDAEAKREFTIHQFRAVMCVMSMKKDPRAVPMVIDHGLVTLMALAVAMKDAEDESSRTDRDVGLQ